MTRCPLDKCNGYVLFRVGERKGACGMCALEVCKRCERPCDGSITEGDEEEEGEEGEGGEEEGGDKEAKKGGKVHRCKKEDMDSVRAVRATTKPCPWPGCGVRIMRSFGCSQMWCTKCNKPFDWTTGECIRGRATLHNPHYTEYMEKQRQLGQGQQQGEADDAEAAGGCGGGPDRHLNHLDLGRGVRNSLRGTLFSFLRHINHCRDDIVQLQLGVATQRSNAERSEHYACMHLTGMITKEELTRRTFLMEKATRFNAEEARILEAACHCAIDLLRPLNIRSTTEECEGVVAQLDRMRFHFNTALNALSERFDGRSTYMINEEWNVRRQQSTRTRKRTMEPMQRIKGGDPTGGGGSSSEGKGEGEGSGKGEGEGSGKGGRGQRQRQPKRRIQQQATGRQQQRHGDR